MALMRRLLLDAQAKFRRMMEENKALASRIDGDIQTAHQEVSLLRAELADTNKRITQITNSVTVSGSATTNTATVARPRMGAAEATRSLSDSPAVSSRANGNSVDSPDGRDDSAKERREPGRTSRPRSVDAPIAATRYKDVSAARSKSDVADERCSAARRRMLSGPPLAERESDSLSSDENNEVNGGRTLTRRVNGGAPSAVIGSAGYATEKSQDADDEGGSIECDRCRRCSHQEGGLLEGKLNTLEEQNEELNRRIETLQQELDALQCLRNQRLEMEEEIQHQQQLLQSGRDDSDVCSTSSRASEASTVKNDVDKLETELRHAKEALAALKSDRKRLKAEKFDLLNQMKQLYGTLEDKEKELRDFIRNYEQRMKESDENLKQLVRDREDSEREKWNILKHARDESERCVALCAQLGLKEAQVKQLQEELTMLNQMRDKVGYFSDVDVRSMGRSNGYRSPSATSTHNGRESTPTPTMGSDPTSSYAGGVVMKDGHRPSLPGLSRSAEEIYNSSGSSDAGSKKSRRRRESKGDGRSSGGGTWGSISRVFSRNKNRKSLDPGFYDGSVGDQRSSWSPQSSLCASPLTEDSYTEKLKLLEEAQGQRMDRWKAATVLAWLEITLGMPQYGVLCAENIKSGKILLELSDPELEAGLGIGNPIHRRKLRLAIEEHRDPISRLEHPAGVMLGTNSMRFVCSPYPKISLLTHTWVVEEWLPSLGLLCYADNFARQLIDGRVLETLTKKDLEKSLGVSRKFHQVSIMHAVQLLRMVKFDKQLLQQRRSHSETMDVDPLVWTNQRFIKWAKSIDLVEYADNLRDSGVHGALVVLEASFQADTMATALGIPASKNIIRRHLTTELENLVQPARMSLEAEALVNSKRGDKKSTSSLSSSASGSLSRTFLRSSSSRGTLDRPDKRRSSMRGSLTRALGLKMEEELSHRSTPELPKTSPEAPKGRSLFIQKRSQSANRALKSNKTSYNDIMTVTPV